MERASYYQTRQMSRLSKKVGYKSWREAAVEILARRPASVRRGLSKTDTETVLRVLQRALKQEKKEAKREARAEGGGSGSHHDRTLALIVTGVAGLFFLLGSILATIIFGLVAAFLWFITFAQWADLFKEDEGGGTDV